MTPMTPTELNALADRVAALRNGLENIRNMPTYWPSKFAAEEADRILRHDRARAASLLTEEGA